MINLLPIENISQNLKHYRQRRLAAAGALLLSISTMVLVVLAVVAWLVRVRAGEVSGQLQSMRRGDEAGELAVLEKEWQATVLQIKVLGVGKQPAEVTAAALWPAIIVKKSKAIRLTELTSSERPAGGWLIGLKGLAATRADFLTFLRALRADATWSAVDSPVENVIRDRNVAFSINLETK